MTQCIECGTTFEPHPFSPRTGTQAPKYCKDQCKRKRDARVQTQRRREARTK